MTNDELKVQYEQGKLEILDRLGQPEYLNREAANESAKQLLLLKGKYLADLRHNNAQNETKPLTESVQPREYAKAKLIQINAINLLESDLKEFTTKERDLLIAWFEDKNQSHRQLANRFGWQYQAVTRFLRDKRVQLVEAKYFNQTLADNTKLALLKLTQSGEPKIVLAAAEYLKLLYEKKDNEAGGAKRIEDEELSGYLKLLGDWYLGTDETLTIQRQTALAGPNLSE